MKIYNFFTEIFTSYQGFQARTWINVLVLLINALGNMATLFMTLYLVTQLHFSTLAASQIVAGFSLGLVIGTYAGGHLCERFSSYHLVVYALFTAGVAIGTFPLLNTYLGLLILALIAGLHYGIFKPANLVTLLADYSETHQSKVMSLYRVAINLGSGLATLIGGILASLHYHWVFWFDGLTSIIAAFILIYFKPLFENLAFSTSGKKRFRLIDIVSNKIFILACIILFLSSLTFYQIQFGYPLYLYHYYLLTPTQFGYLFFLNCILIVLMQVPLLHILRNVNQLTVSTIGAALVALGFFLLPFGSSKLFAIISCVIWTFGEMLLYPILFSLAINALPAEAKSKSIGFYQTVYTTAAVIAPVIGGYLYPIHHGDVLWYICGLWGVLTLLVFGIVNKLLKEKQYC